MYHYDIRLKCPITGKLEATEDSYMTQRSAQRRLDSLNDGSAHSKYVMVSCVEQGNSRIHDVDLDYFEHNRHHVGDKNAELVRYVGVPSHLTEVSDYPWDMGE